MCQGMKGLENIKAEILKLHREIEALSHRLPSKLEAYKSQMENVKVNLLRKYLIEDLNHLTDKIFREAENFQDRLELWVCGILVKIENSDFYSFYIPNVDDLSPSVAVALERNNKDIRLTPLDMFKKRVKALKECIKAGELDQYLNLSAEKIYGRLWEPKENSYPKLSQNYVKENHLK